MNKKKERDEFTEVAERFGITEEDLAGDRVVVLKTGGKTVQEIREKISMATDAMRKVRAESFFDNLKGRLKIGQGIHDRLEAFIFADGDFTDYDIDGMNRHVPIPIMVTCAREITVDTGQCFDLTADAADWNRGKGDDLISILNVKTLQLEKDAKISVRGNLFVIICQKIINYGGSIEILPTDFSYDKSYNGIMDGENGADGSAAIAAEPTPQIQMESTVLGHFYHGHIRGVLNGANGNNGGDGAVGERGFCGGALKIAEINIREIIGKLPLSIQIKGGSGGNGGDGGSGGKGSDGVSGGIAYKTIYEEFPAGRGGNGGSGGNGGKGGRGGNGGISSNVYIEVPKRELVDATVLPGQGGIGGKGGAGGLPGQGGDPFGVDGAQGKDGKNGLPGHNRPAAAVFICGKRI